MASVSEKKKKVERLRNAVLDISPFQISGTRDFALKQKSLFSSFAALPLLPPPHLFSSSISLLPLPLFLFLLVRDSRLAVFDTLLPPGPHFPSFRTTLILSDLSLSRSLCIWFPSSSPRNSRCSHWTGLCPNRCRLKLSFGYRGARHFLESAHLQPLYQVFRFYLVTQTQQVLRVFCSNLFQINCIYFSPSHHPILVNHGKPYHRQPQQYPGSCSEFHLASSILRPQSRVSPATSISRHVWIPFPVVFPKHASVVGGFLQSTVPGPEHHGGCFGSGSTAVAGRY